MFRMFERQQEAMVRMVMPHASQASPEPVRSRYEAEYATVAVRNGVRLVKPLTFRIEEVL